MPTPTPYRYALYFAHLPNSPWWQAGSQWLGRCAARGIALEPPAVPGIDPQQLHRLTAAPRRYGWHATLKAPFVLAPGQTEGSLLEAVAALAGRLPAFDLPPLRVNRLGDFLALTPEPGHPGTAALHHLADTCVRELDAWAAPLPPAELARRRQSALSPEEDALLVRWGYPYVFDRFRFHCSLTGSLAGESDAVVERLHDGARQWFNALPSARCESVAVFAEPAPGADFVLVQHLSLTP